MKSQEFVATKTELFKVLKKFLLLTNAKEDLREGGCADLITMHLISMCGVSEVVCHALSQCNYTSYILRMLGPLSAAMETYTERKHVRKVCFFFQNKKFSKVPQFQKYSKKKFQNIFKKHVQKIFNYCSKIFF